MNYPWKGAARPMVRETVLRGAASRLGCEYAAIAAVWQVEAGGRYYLADGTVIRRFEPHKLKKPVGDWRKSMNIGTAAREAQFMAAYANDREDAMRATSWGAPQIMGFNHKDAGYNSAGSMVEAMADSEQAQVMAFVTLIESWGLQGALRARDWVRFATRYNGSANAAAYAAKIEAAYRSVSGKVSAEVLRPGDTGVKVNRLQQALGMDATGVYDLRTEDEVRSYQRSRGLAVDGIVGAKTWESLEKDRGANPVRQETTTDRTSRVAEGVGVFTAAAGGVATLGTALPESTMNLLVVAMIGVAAVAGILYLVRKYRRYG